MPLVDDFSTIKKDLERIEAEKASKPSSSIPTPESPALVEYINSQAQMAQQYRQAVFGAQAAQNQQGQNQSPLAGNGGLQSQQGGILGGILGGSGGSGGTGPGAVIWKNVGGSN